MAFSELKNKPTITVILWSLFLSSWSSALEMDFVLDGFHGEISSPNYPNNYPLNISFIWTLKKSLGESLRLTFIDFQVEKAKRCIYDSLQIRDKVNLSWDDIPKYCGAELPKDFVTQNEQLQVKFTSDSYNIVDRGFRISWQIEDSNGNRVFDNCIKNTEVTKTECPPVTTVKVLRQLCRKQLCNCNGGYNIEHELAKNGKSNSLSHKIHNFGNRHNSRDLHGGTENVKQLHLDCLDARGNGCKGKVSDAQDKDSSGEKSIAVGIFSSLLVIFVIINIILMVFLWKRNRELDNLKSTSMHFSTSPGLDWIPCGKPAIHVTNSHDSTKTATLTSKNSMQGRNWKPELTECKPHSTVRQYRRRDGSPRSYVKRSMIEQQRYFSLLSGIVKTPRSGRRHSGNYEDESYEETSDIYVSSSYPSPTPSHCPDRFAV